MGAQQLRPCISQNIITLLLHSIIVWSDIESVRNNFSSEFKAFILCLLVFKLLYTSFIFLLLNQGKSDFSSDFFGEC